MAKQYRNSGSTEMGAHERSHTEAFFRKIKFWDDGTSEANGSSATSTAAGSATTHADGEHHGGNSMDGGDHPTNTNPNHKEHNSSTAAVRTGDAPPVFAMPDGQTYFHVKRNGLIFGASSARNVSANTVLEVRL